MTHCPLCGTVPATCTVPKNDGGPPSGTFRSRHFLTPRWLAYYRLPDGYWVELTNGWLRGEPIFGVTVRKSGGGRDTFCRTASKLMYDLHEARLYIVDELNGVCTS